MGVLHDAGGGGIVNKVSTDGTDRARFGILGTSTHHAQTGAPLTHRDVRDPTSGQQTLIATSGHTWKRQDGEMEMLESPHTLMATSGHTRKVFPVERTLLVELARSSKKQANSAVES